VVLQHVSRDDEHWDLMIENGDILATWRLARHPRELSTINARIRCRRISDHRLAYLEYEGPLSGDRGSVRRVDRGMCSIRSELSDRWIVEFRGQILGGTFSIDAIRRDQEGELRREI
jgi:hypothetical protein